MTSQIGYLKLLIARSILSGPLDFEIKRVAYISKELLFKKIMESLCLFIAIYFCVLLILCNVNGNKFWQGFNYYGVLGFLPIFSKWLILENITLSKTNVIFQKSIPSTTNPRVGELETGFFIPVFLLEMLDYVADTGSADSHVIPTTWMLHDMMNGHMFLNSYRSSIVKFRLMKPFMELAEWGWQSWNLADSGNRYGSPVKGLLGYVVLHK